MRVLYHHRTASKDGQAVHIEEMIAALRAEGHEVLVVAPGEADSADRPGSRGRMGGKVGWVHGLKALLPRALYEGLELGYNALAYRRLLKAAREFKPDVIYERYNLFLLAGLMVKRRMGIPLLLEVNAPLVLERSRHSGGLAMKWLARWAEGLAWRGADKVLPVTRVLAAHVKEYNVPDARIEVIANGIDPRHFESAPTRELAKANLGLQERLVLGFTGFVRDWHGVDRVVNWMASPNAPANAHLLVVGDGPVRAALEAQAASLGLASRVTFTGVIDREHVPAHVAAFDVALQPAVTPYASPLKLMEYLVMAKAIVAPATPNLCEVLTDGENALLFDEADPGGLEKALTRLCSQPDLRERLARSARATIDGLSLTWRSNARRAMALVARP